MKTAKGYITANKKNLKGYHTSIGTIKVLVDDLNYYDTARWTNPDGQVNKGEVFTVVKKVGDMYLLKSNFYITASSNFVEKYLDIIQQNKGKKFNPEDGIEVIDESDGHTTLLYLF